jgi:DNA-binding NtrC family response regulator
MKPKILFISTPSNKTFADILAEVISPYGGLDVFTWQDRPDLAQYALIFADASILGDLEHPTSLTDMLEQLMAEHPKAKVVVTTSSPTWKRTRAALIAGAVDYIRQTLDPDSLYNTLYPTLKKYLLDNPKLGE